MTEEWEADAWRYSPPPVRAAFEVVWTGYYYEADDGGHLVADHCGDCGEWGHHAGACPLEPEL